MHHESKGGDSFPVLHVWRGNDYLWTASRDAVIRMMTPEYAVWTGLQVKEDVLHYLYQTAWDEMLECH